MHPRTRTVALCAALALAIALALTPPATAGIPEIQPDDLLASTGANGASMIRIDPATGDATFLFNLGSLGPVTEIVWREDGTLFGTTGGGSANLITIDPVTGTETLVGQHAFGAINGLEFIDGVLYGSFFGPGGPEGGATQLVTIDPDTGQTTSIGTINDFSPVRGLAYDEDTDTLYGVGSAATPPFAEQFFTLDRDTGVATPIGSTGLPGALGGIRFGSDGLLYGGLADTDEGITIGLATIDPATGVGTPISGSGNTPISGLAFAPGAPPSPLEIPTASSVGLALLALLLLAVGVRRLRLG